MKSDDPELDKCRQQRKLGLKFFPRDNRLVRAQFKILAEHVLVVPVTLAPFLQFTSGHCSAPRTNE
jgi:hypothetical protein